MGQGELISLSERELSRVQVIQDILDRHLTQHKGAERLGIGIRQVKRLCQQLRVKGAAGLVSKRRGKPSNHQLPAALKDRAVELLKSTYTDFGPTLACEKLAERHGVVLGIETVRQMMITEGLWRPKRQRQSKNHPRRERRSCRGELVQMDGSPHKWFEDRGPTVTLLATIDDANSEILALHFAPVEDTWGYLALLDRHLEAHGRPEALYTDRHSIFRATTQSPTHPTEETQMARALRQLDIHLICALTPQAKGRVERLFETLQDRLVKDLRLHGINTIAQANAFAPTFLKQHNQRFAVCPAAPEDAHRPLTPWQQQHRSAILSCQEARHLSKTLTLQYRGLLLQIETTRPAYALRHKTVMVLETQDGQIQVQYQDQTLAYRVVALPPKQGQIMDAKEIAVAPTKTTRRPAAMKPSPAFRRSVSRSFLRSPATTRPAEP